MNHYSFIKKYGLVINNKLKAGPGREIAFLGKGETKLELVYDESIQEVKIGEDISLDSVAEMMDFVREKGLVIHSGSFQPNPTDKVLLCNRP